MKEFPTAIAFSTYSQAAPRRAGFWQPAQQALAALGRWLMAASLRGREPRINLKRDRRGEAVWEVFDPVSGASATFTCEREVRAWLERRYYQP